MGTQASTDELDPAPSVDDAPEEASEETPEEESLAPLSMEEAFQSAKVDEAEPEEDQAPAAGAVPEPPAQEADPSPPQPTAQELPLPQAYQAWLAGRHNEVSLQQRTYFQAVATNAALRAEQQHTDETLYKAKYLEYLALQEEDPVAFNELILSREPVSETSKTAIGWAVQEFMRGYRQAHPEVTLENPDAPTNRRGDIREQTLNEAFSAVDAGIAAMAQNFGMSDAELNEAFTKSQGNFSTFLTESVRQAISKGVAEEVAKLRPKLEQENREAAELQAQQKMVNGAPAAARRFASSAATGRKTRPSDPWAAALEIAKESVG